jgi:hypothetical protein
MTSHLEAMRLAVAIHVIETKECLVRFWAVLAGTLASVSCYQLVSIALSPFSLDLALLFSILLGAIPVVVLCVALMAQAFRERWAVRVT